MLKLRRLDRPEAARDVHQAFMPFGCRAWAIKQTRNKTAIESTARA
jgi:hypothetical protein